MEQKENLTSKDKLEESLDNSCEVIPLSPEEVKAIVDSGNEVISSLPDEKQHAIREFIKIERFQGPLPHPDILAKYNDISPKLVERIFKMAENDQEHIIKHNEEVLRLRGRDYLLGVIFSFLIVIGAGVAGVILLLCGKDIGGYGALLASVISATVVFLKSNKEEKDKQE